MQNEQNIELKGMSLRVYTDTHSEAVILTHERILSRLGDQPHKKSSRAIATEKTPNFCHQGSIDTVMMMNLMSLADDSKEALASAILTESLVVFHQLEAAVLIAL